MANKIFSLLLTFFTMLGNLLPIHPPEKTQPVFGETAAREQTEFDEGSFTPGSYDLFVSPNGNNSNIGTEEAPLRSIEGAKERLKTLRIPKDAAVTVWFSQGEYPIKKTVAFTENDRSHVLYRSKPGEKVVFSGGIPLTDWEQTTVNGVRAFVTDCRIENAAETINVLYNGDTRLSRSRYPKQGEFSVAAAYDRDCFAPTQSYFKIHTAFYGNKKDLMNFHNLQDVDVRILHYWNDELLPLRSVDTQNGRIEMTKPASMTIAKDDRYFFENVFEALSEVHEWYFDRETEKLYYIPAEDETVDNTVLTAGYTETAITVNGCEDISFQGIQIKDTAWKIFSGSHFVSGVDYATNPLSQNIQYQPNFPQACYDAPAAVQITNSSKINFTDCTFCHIGSSALMFDLCTENCSVRSSFFYDIGGNAVYIKGNNSDNPDDQTHDITVTDCHIQAYGRVFNNAIGVLLIHARNCEISQNEIHDGFYTAISSGWVWGYAYNVTDYITIKNNLIYDIGQGWLSDMGGIYTLGVQPHSLISGNVIHDVGCYEGGSGYGGWGVYLDEGTSYMTVENNLCYRCTSEGFHQHYGENNQVRNNIFALNGDGQVRVSKHEDHNSLYLTGNILYADDSPMYCCVKKSTFTDSKNLYWDCKTGARVRSTAAEKMTMTNRLGKLRVKWLGYYNEPVFADPFFKDAEHGDFTLAQNSPASQIGFTPWNYCDAGTLRRF